MIAINLPAIGLSPGLVVSVPFPFADLTGIKNRPAVVISNHSFNDQHPVVAFCMITSREANWTSDVALLDWQLAGLDKACTVRMKLFSLDKTLIQYAYGNLSPNDWQAISQNIQKMIV